LKLRRLICLEFVTGSIGLLEVLHVRTRARAGGFEFLPGLLGHDWLLRGGAATLLFVLLVVVVLLSRARHRAQAQTGD
jgi:hypothetical protein